MVIDDLPNLDEVRALLPVWETPDPILTALQNCENFDTVHFHAWVQTQPKTVQQIAKLRPPNRVYMLVTRDSIICYVAGYSKDGAVIVREVGREEANIWCCHEELKDVTDDLRRERGLPVPKA